MLWWLLWIPFLTSCELFACNFENLCNALWNCVTSLQLSSIYSSLYLRYLGISRYSGYTQGSSEYSVKSLTEREAATIIDPSRVHLFSPHNRPGDHEGKIVGKWFTPKCPQVLQICLFAQVILTKRFLTPHIDDRTRWRLQHQYPTVAKLWSIPRTSNHLAGQRHTRPVRML